MSDTRILDSRDLIEEADDLRVKLEEEGMLDESDAERLAAIDALADEGIEDWQYGATLIREDYFTEYAQQLAEDIGAVNSEAAWPLSYIDWEAAAEALQMDYTTVEFDGSTYYVR